MTRRRWSRVRHWLRCPTCGGRFGRHDLSDFVGQPGLHQFQAAMDRTKRAAAAWQARQDRGTSG